MRFVRLASSLFSFTLSGRRRELGSLFVVAGAASLGAMTLAVDACESSDDSSTAFDGNGLGDAGLLPSEDASALAPPASVRSCGRNGTVAATTTVQLVVPSYRSVQLGQRVDAEGNLLPDLEELGDPFTFGGYLNGGSFGTASFPIDLTMGNGDHSLEVIADGGVSALGAVADAFAPTATRMIHGDGISSTAPPYMFDDASIVDGAPDAGYVYSIAPQEFVAYALRLDFPDACAVGALSDLLVTGDPTSIDQKALFLNASEPRVSELLVRENVQASIVVVSNKHRAAVEALFPNGTTACSVGTFAECAALDEKVADAINSDADDGGEPSLSSVQSGTNPLWSATGYSTTN